MTVLTVTFHNKGKRPKKVSAPISKVSLETYRLLSYIEQQLNNLSNLQIRFTIWENVEIEEK